MKLQRKEDKKIFVFDEENTVYPLPAGRYEIIDPTLPKGSSLIGEK